MARTAKVTALHRLIYWGLKNFASPEANMLILRHFTLATELLGFIKANAGNVKITPAEIEVPAERRKPAGELVGLARRYTPRTEDPCGS